MDPSVGAVARTHHAVVNDVEHVQAQVAEVVVDGINQLLARNCVKPRFILAPPATQFGDYHQTIRIGMKRPFDDLVGDMRTVVVARIDMIDACRNRLSQNSYRTIDIARRSPHRRTGKLHRAIANSLETYSKYL